MRWFRIRKANIDSELRNTFERNGANVMQVILATTNYFYHSREGEKSRRRTGSQHCEFSGVVRRPLRPS